MSQYTRYPDPAAGIKIYPSAVNFPSSAQDGAQAVAADTNTIYIYDTSVPGWQPVANPGAAVAIDALQGDVSATGPGVVNATVNSVGGAAAADIASATSDVLAATALATPSTIVKRDVSANSAFNALQVNDGSALAPSYSFSNSLTTGLFSLAVDTLNFATAGVSRLAITPSGNVGINTSSPNAKLQINNSGTQLGLSVYSTSSNNTAELYNQGTTNYTLALNSAANSAMTGASIGGYFARGTLSSRAQTLANDSLLSISASGHTGSSFAGISAAIVIGADQNTTSTAYGGQIVLATTPNSTPAGFPIPRLYVKNDGKVNIPGLTASQIIATDGSQNLQSLSTATYPSLTELSYVKGVTSSIQSQLNALQPAGNYITALTGEVTATGPGSVAATISANAVTNAKLAKMAANTIKGNNTAGPSDPLDLTATQTTAMLDVMVGDSGAGGTKGLVPAPVTGDATKFLRGDATWATVDLSNLANKTLSNLTAPTALNQVLLGQNGTVAAPAYSFTNNTDMGMYRSAANTLNLAITGKSYLQLSSGLVRLGDPTSFGTPLVNFEFASPNNAGTSVFRMNYGGTVNNFLVIGGNGAYLQFPTQNLWFQQDSVSFYNVPTIGVQSSGTNPTLYRPFGVFSRNKLGAGAQVTANAMNGGVLSSGGAIELQLTRAQDTKISANGTTSISYVRFGDGGNDGYRCYGVGVGDKIRLSITGQPDLIVKVLSIANSGSSKVYTVDQTVSALYNGADAYLQSAPFLVFDQSGTIRQEINYSGDISLSPAISTSLSKETRFIGSTSGYVGISSPASPTSYSLVLPSAQGAANTVPVNDGSGNLSWGLRQPNAQVTRITKSADYNVASGDDYIGCDSTGSSFTLTLPAANTVSNGKKYIFKDEGGFASTNAIFISPSGTDKIDGVNATTSLDVGYESITLVCNGADSWFII